MFTRVLRSPDADGGGAATHSTASTSSGQAATAEAAPLRIGGVDGLQTDLRARFTGVLASSGPLTDNEVRIMLADCCTFLQQLAKVTGAVIETVGVGQVRQIVASEFPVPRGVILEDATTVKTDTPAPDRDPSSASGRDHRKEPRGRRHPVITLMQMALQGIRLMLRITAGTNPNAHNEESLEQMKTREELREQERTFKALLKGGV